MKGAWAACSAARTEQVSATDPEIKEHSPPKWRRTADSPMLNTDSSSLNPEYPGPFLRGHRVRVVERNPGKGWVYRGPYSGIWQFQKLKPAVMWALVC